MNEQDIWVELYDPKEGRKLREIPMQFKCKECEGLGGHRLDCSSATKEQLYRIAKTAQDAESQARKRADRYWQMLQQYQGKLAVLRHENNKLRKANERLKVSIESKEIAIVKCQDCNSNVGISVRDSGIRCWNCAVSENNQ